MRGRVLGRLLNARSKIFTSVPCKIEGELKDSFYRDLTLIFHIQYSTKLVSGLSWW